MPTVERVVRLIRSRCVSIYFASQNALDIPSTLPRSSETSEQRSMRAFSPAEAKKLRAVAQTFR
jgi:hypothetical protein